MIDPAAFAINGLSAYIELVARILKRIRVRVGWDGITFWVAKELKPVKPQDVDQRIAKIETARQNLLEGLEAIDDLKATAEANKVEVERVLADVARLKQDKKLIANEVESIRKIATSDIQTFRKVAGILGPAEVRRERVTGFISGVVASVLASGVVAMLIWAGKHLWRLYSTWP
jgi:hypothetical protein